jgi:S1-C subfamily serine protease
MNDFPSQTTAKKPAPPPLPPKAAPPARSRNRDDEVVERPRPARRRRFEDDEPEPTRGGSHGALIAILAGGAVLFLALLAGGVYLVVRPTSKPKATEAEANPPVVTQLADVRPGPVNVASIERPAAKPVAPAPPPVIKDNAIAAVKASTVYIKCQHTAGRSSGSGFFAGKPGYVVTNAHVIGQMQAQTREEAMAGPVQRIDVVINSGEPNERNFIAHVYGIDRVHDLAMLTIDGENLPPPLEFGNAAGLNETDEVIIFGYPFGEQVGKNISINKSTVTSLRKKNGELAMVQIGGGMNPGNSGGPVTNRAGQVVGVSVAKIMGADGIDFAIPAEQAESFVREQLKSGGNGPEEVAKGPPAVGPLPGMGGPPFGPPGRPGRPGRVPIVPRPGPAAPEPPTREAPGWGPKPVRSVTGAKPQMLGFGLGPEFRELAPKDGLLIGLELGLNPDGNRFIVRQARPIYLVGDKEVKGEQRGKATGPTVTLKAKTGYAVGALICKHGLAVDGLSLVFMKLKDKRLDTKDSYESEWAGSSPPEMQATRLEGGGMPGVGLVGRADANNLIAIATVFRGQEEAIGPVAPTGTKQTQIVGGGNQEFQDTAPAGGLLVGFHFGMGKFFDNDVIHGVRPIYRVGDKEKLGTPFGTDFTRLKKVVAKPGYAVGAIAMKTGLGLDGVTVTFMKIDGDKLDPSDSYDADYVGGPGGGGPNKVGGDGTPVVGLIGRTNGKEVCGLGLVVRK